jgi:hypothetical protein
MMRVSNGSMRHIMEIIHIMPYKTKMPFATEAAEKFNYRFMNALS